MIIGNFKHNSFIHSRCHRYLGMFGAKFDPVITFGFSRESFDSDSVWEPFDEWLRTNGIEYCRWTPFSSYWRIFYTFARKEDAMLFKLTFFK